MDDREKRLEEAERIVDEWERLEGESLREGHRATLERLILEHTADLRSRVERREREWIDMANEEMKGSMEPSVSFIQVQFGIRGLKTDLYEAEERVVDLEREVERLTQERDKWRIRVAALEASMNPEDVSEVDALLRAGSGG